jgi:DNA-binding response OmpR family regulator
MRWPDCSTRICPRVDECIRVVTLGGRPVERLMQMRILVVEDSPVQASLICELLERNGLEVDWKASIADAWEGIRSAPPDLVLLDRMLPDGDGSDLCRSLKADPSTREIPVILLTSQSGVQDRVEGLLGGADDYIPKPYQPEELLARVHGCLRTRALQQEIRRKAEALEQKNQELLATQARLVRAERLAAIGEVGLAIRHEINNPLGTVLGFAELLLSQPGNLPPEVMRKLEAISRASARIRDVVRRLESLHDDRTVEYLPGVNMTDLRPETPTGEEKNRS